MKSNKKLFITIFILFFTFFSVSIVQAADSTNNTQELSLVSKSAFLMDNKTNKILFSKDAEKKMYPASTTKILTAILAIENCNLDDPVTVSYNAVMSIPEGYSNANLQIGEQLTVEQLLQLLLVHSANDAANVLAEHVGGSIESFVSIMNTKLSDLKLSNTHFTNSFGEHDENHYTTAHDLAYLMQYCMKNENFRKIAGSASCSIPSTNKYGHRSYSSTNELIIPNSKSYYQYLTAGKTGYTAQAGDCLVSCGFKDNLELICVILGGKTITTESTRFSETRKLYDYGFSNYSIKNIINKGDTIHQIDIKNATNETKNLDLIADEEISVLVKNSDNFDNLKPAITLNENLSAPIYEGDFLGKAVYEIDGNSYAINLIASHDVSKSFIFEIILSITIVIVIICLVICIRRKKSRKKHRNKKTY